MNKRLNLEHLVTDWLDADASAIGSDRVLAAALVRVTSVGQARHRPGLRFAKRSTYAKLAVAAAAVVLVVVAVGLPPAGPGPRASGAGAAPTAAISRNPGPSWSPDPNSPLTSLSSVEALVAGNGYETESGLSFIVPTSGWYPFYILAGSEIRKGTSSAALYAGETPRARISFGLAAPNGVYADPCRHVRSEPVGRSTETDAINDHLQHSADLAAAVASIPGTDVVTGPSDVAVGGLPAKHVVITVRGDIGCDGRIDLWYDWDRGSFSMARGDTIRIWIVDYAHLGLRYWIEAETPQDASPTEDQEIRQIIDSIVVIIG